MLRSAHVFLLLSVLFAGSALAQSPPPESVEPEIPDSPEDEGLGPEQNAETPAEDPTEPRSESTAEPQPVTPPLESEPASLADPDGLPAENASDATSLAENLGSPRQAEAQHAVLTSEHVAESSFEEVTLEVPHLQLDPLPPVCSPTRRALAPIVALTVGAFVSGAGQYTLCDPAAGRRLIGARVVSLGSLFLGGGGLVMTGASRKTIPIFAGLAIFGIGGTLFTYLADVYGALTAGANAGRPAPSSTLELAAGYRFVHDVRLGDLHAAHLRARTWFGTTRLNAEADIALGGDNQRLSLGIRQRLAGNPGRGNAFDIQSGLTFHRYGEHSFHSLVLEVNAIGRLHLETIGRNMRGSFVEGQLGLGYQGFAYPNVDRGLSDFNSLLLAVVRYGVYIGESGEVSAFYNHRRDRFAGGLALDGVAAGNFGHIGLEGRGFFGNGRFGLAGHLHYGSALTFGLNLLYRTQPDRPEEGATP